MADGNRGGGFSIVSLQCALIEFFAASIAGKNYRFGATGNSLTEYGNSKQLFVAFLHSHAVFSAYFDQSLARDFYENVRCGLLHEARTKNGWRIKAGKTADPPIDRAQKVIFRNALQKVLQAFVKQYETDLETDVGLQAGFVRKLDGLFDV
jgi:hypothetical protein